MNKADVAGLKIDAITKQGLIASINQRIAAGQKTWITTPYSEFLYAGLQDNRILETLNKADFAVPDGIGIFWAKRYLDLPLTSKSYWTKILQALWQVKYSLAAIIFYPSWIKSALPEKIVGADLVLDLAKFAASNNLSIFLLGGFGNTAELVKQKLISKYPNILISGTSNKHPDDKTTLDDVNQTNIDILFVAYGPIKQEKWIAENLSKLNIKLAIGVGGSFDYIAGKKSAPPKFIRYAGLEWLWRLVTQPYRIKRIFFATFGLANELLLYKIFTYLPYRKNVADIILNNKNQVLVVQRNPQNKKSYIAQRERSKYLNYWQFPQGGINENESIEKASQREAQEETGLKNLKPVKISNFTHQYNFTATWKRLWDKNYRYRGQLQNIVYLKLPNDNAAIKLDNDEIINYQWVEILDLKNIVHSERANLLKIVLNDLKEMQEKAII